MPLVFPSPHKIDHFIGSPAYRDSWHPQSVATCNSVTNWFAARYGSDSCGKRRDIRNARQNHIVCRALKGKTLLVGEGNFTFTASLVFDHYAAPMSITSTIHENICDISDDAKANAMKLAKARVTVLDNIDATHLGWAFHHQIFDTIIFQFPNAGSREPKRGHNPNHVLMRRFLRSAIEQLQQGGEIIVTVVNNAYYDGRFRMDEAAEYAGIKNMYAIPFLLDDFPSYSHVNTKDEDSALKEHPLFKTWILQP